jgi:ribose transport system ATP-binding protein
MKQLVAASIGPGHAALHARERTTAGSANDLRTQQANQAKKNVAEAARPVLTLSKVGNDRLRDADLIVGKGEVTDSRD